MNTARDKAAKNCIFVEKIRVFSQRTLHRTRRFQRSNTQRDLKEEAVMNELEQRLAQQQDLLGQMARKRSELTSALNISKHFQQNYHNFPNRILKIPLYLGAKS